MNLKPNELSRAGNWTLAEFFAALDAHQEPIPLTVLSSGLKRLRLDRSDVEDYVQFSSERYRRNLMHAGPRHHALVLCWLNGQRSPIHDHRGSACGVRVIQGEATETTYEMTEEGLVFPVRTRKAPTGFICATQDLDIHEIANLQPDNAELITLHIYSPPLLVMGQYSLTEPGRREFKDEVSVLTEGAGI